MSKASGSASASGRPWVTWAFAVAALAVAPAAYACDRALTYATTHEIEAVSCARAMEAIGWELPAGTSKEACEENDEGEWSSSWSGTFHMPRSETHQWITSLPGKHSRTVRDAEDDFGLYVNYPPHREGLDGVRIDVQPVGADSSAVTFQTWNG